MKLMTYWNITLVKSQLIDIFDVSKKAPIPAANLYTTSYRKKNYANREGDSASLGCYILSSALP